MNIIFKDNLDPENFEFDNETKKIKIKNIVGEGAEAPHPLPSKENMVKIMNLAGEELFYAYDPNNLQ